MKSYRQDSYRKKSYKRYQPVLESWSKIKNREKYKQKEQYRPEIIKGGNGDPESGIKDLLLYEFVWFETNDST